MWKKLIPLTFLLILGACTEAMVTPAASVQKVSNYAPQVTVANSVVLKWPVNSTVLESEVVDPDGDQIMYRWSLVSGKSDARIENPNGASTGVSNLSLGDYIFQLRVTDPAGNITEIETSVSVIKVSNTAPVATAPSDKSLSSSQTFVTLTGRGSDVDGDPLTYRWTQTKGPVVSLASPFENSTLVTGLVPGQYIFLLTVTDNGGASGTDEVVVNVNVAGNIPPVANAGTDQTITYPVTSVTLKGTVTDPDSSTVSATWSKYSGGNATFSSTSDLNPTVIGLQPGYYQFRLEAKDGYGAVHVDEVKVTVIGKPNTTPTADAGPAQTITLPTNSVVLNGVGKDAEGDVLKYEWVKVSTLAGAITTPTFASTNVTGLAEGSHKFRLKVSDATTYSTSEVIITVLPKVNVANGAPTANAGPDITIYLPTNSAVFGGTGTDPNGDALTYAWSQVTNLKATIGSPNQSRTLFSNLEKGTYTFRLTVKDIYGATGFDDMTLTVADALTGAPPAPVPGKLQIWTRNDPTKTWYPEYDAVVYLPKTYSTTKKFPLIISLYGVGGRVLTGDHKALPSWHEGFINQVWDGAALQATFPAIVIAPEGRAYDDNNNVWWDATRLKKLLDAAMQFYSVDPERVVVTGLSSGGAGTLSFVGAYPDLIAGAMPLSMGPPGADVNICTYTKFPMWVNGNADDGIFNLWAWKDGNPNFQDDIETCPNYTQGSFILTYNPTGGHGGWDQWWSRADVQSWLTTRIRGQNPPY